MIEGMQFRMTPGDNLMTQSAYTQACYIAGTQALIALRGGRDRLEVCDMLAARYGVEAHHISDALDDMEWRLWMDDQEHAYEETVLAGYRARGQANIY
jgi:hypothetical protein